ncbi:recombinase family protein [Vibrio parahaemolyticus]|nr:recombinase family protein [Vibrio parahaemolyticus]
MLTMTRTVAIYLRVSTGEQSTETQLLELMGVVKQANWQIYRVYEDAGVSGSKGRDKRPDFDQMQKDAVRRKFNLVLAWSVDRLGRSLQDLISFLNELHGVGCDLYLHQQGLDTTTPAGKAMFQMLGVFAEFERSMIQERVKAGLARARTKGKTLGRAKVAEDVEAKIRELRTSTNPPMGMIKIAKTLGVGTGTVQRVVKAMSEQ